MPKLQAAFWFFVLRLLLVNCQEVTEEQSDVTILRQINRLNDDGSYTFGYEAADGSFKIETRDVEGNVKGMFGFVDENGELKRISYSSKNGTGFQASGTIATPVDNVRLNPSYTTVKPPTNHHPFLKRPILILKAMTPVQEENDENDEEEDEEARRTFYNEQHRRRPKQDEREFLRNSRPVPILDNNELTAGRPVMARKILVAKRPSEDANEKRPRGGSGLRRQLGRGQDMADTRGTGSGGYLSGQSPAIPSKLALLASLMNEFEASSRSYPDNGYAGQEQYPKVTYADPDYADYSDVSTPTPSPVPRQLYPITTPIPPPTPGYLARPGINPGVGYRNPYPVVPRESYNAVYNSLREELMEYILQILQQRLLQGQYGLPQQYPNQNIAPPPPLPYAYDQGYNPLRSYIPNQVYQPQSYLPGAGRYPLSYLNGRNYPQQPLPLVSPNIQYSEPVKYPSMEDLTTQNPPPKIFSSRRLIPRRKFRPSPQVEENSYEYTTQASELGGGNLVTSPTRSAPPRYASSTSTTESSRLKSSQPVRNVQIIESESRVSSSTVSGKSSKPITESSSSSINSSSSS
uniref:Uncharacterized protein n=1 Tax=Cacopsylla melanoneura TaxID=428564 RepID=A0A8D9AY86_9HEMI